MPREKIHGAHRQQEQQQGTCAYHHVCQKIWPVRVMVPVVFSQKEVCCQSGKNKCKGEKRGEGRGLKKRRSS